MRVAGTKEESNNQQRQVLVRCQCVFERDSVTLAAGHCCRCELLPGGRSTSVRLGDRCLACHDF